MDGKRHESKKFIEQIKRELGQAIKCEEIRRMRSLLSSIRSSNSGIASDPLESNGYTALHLAAACNFEEGLSLLLDFGVNVSAVSSWGETALHVACESQFNGIVDLLLQSGECDVDLKTRGREETALGVAARVGNAQGLRLLLQNGATVDASDKEGNSALHHAVLKTRYEIAKELLAFGADPKLKNAQQRTPLYIAMKVMNDARLTEILVKQRANGLARATAGESVSVSQTKWDNKARNGGFGHRRTAVANAAALNKLETASSSTTNQGGPTAAIRASRASVFRSQFQSERQEAAAPSVAGHYQTAADRSERPTAPASQLVGPRHMAYQPSRKRGSDDPQPLPPRDEVVDGRPRRDNVRSACVQTGPEVENAFRPRGQPTLPQLEQSEAYAMRGSPRGICLIFNNETYWHDDFKERSGADIDERRLNVLFNSLNFKVKIHKNLNAAEIFWEVVNIAKNTDHSKYSCFLCCILSHGSLGTIYGVDGDSFRISDLTVALTASRCPSLAGKPKIFFIQSCRGDEYQAGLHDYHDHDAFRQGEVSRMVPDHADFLLGYATVAGYRAQRHKNEGSVYVQTLCSHLEKECKTNDLLSILTKVNAKVGDYSFDAPDGGKYKQMPEVRHTLTKKIFFA